MILGLGCLACDHVLFTDTPWDAGKGRIVRSETRIGGNARNALATVAALGYPAGYVATVGTSAVGEQAMADLVEHGIDTRFVERVAGADPVTATITVTSGGDRYIAFDDSSLATTPLPSSEIVDAALAVADVILVDATNAPPGSLPMTERARSAGIPVIVDAERDPTPDMRALMDVADHLVIPLGVGAMITGHDDPARIAGALWSSSRSVIVLTDGSRGAYVFGAPEDMAHVPAYRVDAVDTTGCGDAFHGAYAWALATGMDLVERVAIASAAAAVVAGLPSGVPRVATWTDIERVRS